MKNIKSIVGNYNSKLVYSPFNNPAKHKIIWEKLFCRVYSENCVVWHKIADFMIKTFWDENMELAQELESASSYMKTF